MDIILQGKSPELDMPYFGRQSRFFHFFDECLSPLLGSHGTYAETNSGSISNIYQFAKKGFPVIVNDISPYSHAIAKAVLSDDVPRYNQHVPNVMRPYLHTYSQLAAFFAGLIDIYGYNPALPQSIDKSLQNRIESYEYHLNLIHDYGVRARQIYRLDLFDFLNLLIRENVTVQVMFMDFAWPWRDGTPTIEYDTTANKFNQYLFGNNLITSIWDKTNVVERAISAIRLAQQISQYVVLSNQSSNYPTPEHLEVALLRNGLIYTQRHTMLTDAEYEDNLNRADYFREYLYVIPGVQ